MWWSQLTLEKEQGTKTRHFRVHQSAPSAVLARPKHETTSRQSARAWSGRARRARRSSAEPQSRDELSVTSVFGPEAFSVAAARVAWSRVAWANAGSRVRPSCRPGGLCHFSSRNSTFIHHLNLAPRARVPRPSSRTCTAALAWSGAAVQRPTPHAQVGLSAASLSCGSP